MQSEEYHKILVLYVNIFSIFHESVGNFVENTFLRDRVY